MMAEHWFYRANAEPLLEVAQHYRKRTTTPAVRIDGPFFVETLDGVMRCDDGWLAADTLGNPFPIAADVFSATYELADPSIRCLNQQTGDTP